MQLHGFLINNFLYIIKILSNKLQMDTNKNEKKNTQSIFYKRKYVQTSTPIHCVIIV